MGKTPLLPLFAAALGASDLLLGLVVSVSTVTGMITKPLFGFLSDRQGRRWWLLLGTGFFSVTPFFYAWIETPEQLALLRVVHGVATAIYGPVTLAFVVEQSGIGHRKAEAMGWFGLARSGGYVVGPVAAGWLLLYLEPAAVFTVIGVLSALAFVPIALLNEEKIPAEETLEREDEKSGRGHARMTLLVSLFTSAKAPAIWLSGGLESILYIATYATKAFLPIYAIGAGFNPLQIGLFFSVQEVVQILAKPVGGRLGDRMGHPLGIGLGMILVGSGLPLLTMVQAPAGLLLLSVLLGIGQALIIPCTAALIAEQVQEGLVGAGMGLAGSLKNLGKVIGPGLGGGLVALAGYVGMFWGMAVLLVIVGAVLLIGSGLSQLRTTLKRVVQRSSVSIRSSAGSD